MPGRTLRPMTSHNAYYVNCYVGRAYALARAFLMAFPRRGLHWVPKAQEVPA